MTKIKNYATVAVFFLIIVGFMLANIITPDAESSLSERRKLAQFPELTAESVFSGKFSSSFEEYALDQFVLRDSIRTIKALSHFYVFAQKDNNGIYIAGGSVSKLEYPLKDAQINYAVKLINKVDSELFEGKNIYYSIVPDKNYFIAGDNGYPAMDYDTLFSIVNEGVTDAGYIDITGCLDISDYYVTDTHWKQSSLSEVVDKISSEMGLSLPALSTYEAHTLSPFYGVYYGQSALPLSPDSITYLTNEATEASTVFNLEKNEEQPVYMLDRFDGTDSYDIFLSGASAFETITNPLNDSGKTLVIFRDSFGSSLVPLLLDGYSTVYVADLSYIPSSLLADYIDVDSVDDVLWIYSTLILNSASIMR